VVRFSNATGLPQLTDNDPSVNPRGMAIRFQLAEHVHTDIVSHSVDGFPVRTGPEFLEFLRAVATSDPSKLSGSPLEAFLGSHPVALAFVQPKPVPSSFAREAYFGVTALRFTNQAGVSRYGRYRIVPDAGVEHLDDATAKSKNVNFLFDDLPVASRLVRSASIFLYRFQTRTTSWMTQPSTGLRTGP
jgi:catalase